MLFDRLIALSLPLIPRFVVRRVAGPYIAGETLTEALSVVRDLNGMGALATLDLLGEEIRDAAKAREVAEEYRGILDEIGRHDLRSGLSVKLTALGLRTHLRQCRELLERVVDTAREHGRFIRIDMEDSSTTNAALAFHRGLRKRGFENVGVVLQAALLRTEEDARRLLRDGVDVRLVKGIYVEPESIAWRDPEAIRQSFVRLLRLLLEGGARVAVATHDDVLIGETRALMEELALAPGDLEFQLLLGVREGLRDRLLADGHRVRIYVPFGRLWYEYSVRRLRENPAIAGHVTRALFKRRFRS
ncbi:MAG: proline dehydrogenase family protein [Planctomycetota bacterium]